MWARSGQYRHMWPQSQRSLWIQIGQRESGLKWIDCRHWQKCQCGERARERGSEKESVIRLRRRRPQIEPIGLDNGSGWLGLAWLVRLSTLRDRQSDSTSGGQQTVSEITNSGHKALLEFSPPDHIRAAAAHIGWAYRLIEKISIFLDACTGWRWLHWLEMNSPSATNYRGDGSPGEPTDMNTSREGLGWKIDRIESRVRET